MRRKIPFDVYLPATAGKEAVYAKTIQVEEYENFGEEFLTPESSELIERDLARHLGFLHGKDIRDLRKRLGPTQNQFSNLFDYGKNLFPAGKAVAVNIICLKFLAKKESLFLTCNNVSNMKSVLNLIVLCLAVLLISACSFDNATNSAYNVGSRAGVFAAEDTLVVIGVEKFSRRKSGLLAEDDVDLMPSSATSHPELALSHPERLHDIDKKINSYLKSGWRSMEVSHVVYCDDQQRVHFPYNLRALNEDDLPPKRKMETAFSLGQKEVSKWARTDLPKVFHEANLKGRPYTHVIVMCMGWVNDQEESVMRFRNIAQQVKKEAYSQGDHQFRPLVIGFTWPSGWLTNADSETRRKLGHISSYVGKSRDADELGLRVICPFVFQDLRPAIPDGIPLIGIGHSFGARAMSRAAYSQPLLKGSVGRQFDLLISLQGAYSLRRWLPEESLEGAPYLIKNPPPHYITSSPSDKANPIAFWSNHVGAGKTISKAESRPESFQTIDWCTKEKKFKSKVNCKKLPIIVNASGFVTGTSPTNVDIYNVDSRDGHNDILNIKTGQFIYTLLKISF